jgi:hypothetical protein
MVVALAGTETWFQWRTSGTPARDAAWDATVVFDGGGNPSSTGTPERVAGVSVVFSPHGTDADSLVESISRKSRDRGDEVFVVSSDAHVQWAVMGRNVARVSADEFGRDLAEESEEMFEHTPSGSIKSRLEDRIDPEIRAALARMLHP